MVKMHIINNDFDLDDKIAVYIDKKIGGLDKYLPRNLKNTLEGTAILSYDVSGREDNQYICEVTIQLPGPNILSKEATVNMYAAIDIVAAKMKAQAIKYKDKHDPKSRRGVIFMNKLMGRGVRLEPTPEVLEEGL